MTDPCACGHRMTEDITTLREALPYGMQMRRYYCVVCGRDRYVSPDPLPDASVLLSAKQRSVRLRQRNGVGQLL